eukprot:gene21353-32833_t
MTGIASPGLHWFEESDLEVHGKLGEGSYGAVHRVKSKATGAWLAVKKVGAEWFDYGLPPSTMREIATLAQLGPHPNIVRLFGVMESADSEFLLCFELCEGGDLNDRLEEYCGRAVDSQASGSSVGSAQPKRVGIPLARSIIGQVSSGLAHMHRHSLMHRDVKPMNILTDKPLHTVKICDFGMVRWVCVRKSFSGLDEYCGRTVDSQASGSSVGSAQLKRVSIPLVSRAGRHRHNPMRRDVKPMNTLTDKPQRTVETCDCGMV